jgi:hypothetical protein
MMLTEIAVIVQVPANKRSPQRRQKAERFQDADSQKVGAEVGAKLVFLSQIL